MEALISIVVPVYNGEGFLEETLESIIMQSYKHWECILVNDGSTDSSGAICDKFSQRDKRFKVLHQENQKLASARNNGMDIAKGEWLTFLDADDKWDTEYLQRMCHYATTNNVDMAMCHAVAWYPNGYNCEILPMEINGIDSNQYPISDFINASINQGYATKKMKCQLGFFNTSWGKLFRLKFLRQHGLRQPTQIRYVQDQVFMIDFLCANPKFILFNEVLYYYRMNPSSGATHSYKSDYPIIYREYLDHIGWFVQQPEGHLFISSYYYAVCSWIVNSLRHHYFNPENPKSTSESLREFRQLLCNEPFRRALHKSRYGLQKNTEAKFVVFIIKTKTWFLLPLIYKIRPYIKNAYIYIRGKRNTEWIN